MKTIPYLDENTWRILYSPGFRFQKFWGFVKGYCHRIFWLFRVWPYQWIFIHREIAPLGASWMAWWIAKIAGKKIIYDFDDAIWIRQESSVHSLWGRFKSYGQPKVLCRYSHRVSCGNPFLAEYAKKFNSRVHINPTTIDTTGYHLPKTNLNNIPVIGWTGSHSTLQYLESLAPMFEIVRRSHRFKLKVICNRPPEVVIPELEYVPWNKASEIADLNTIDIGVMPLPDTPWSRGKCGFKILQYMALEKVALASAIGINTDIIQHGHNGLLCHSLDDWVKNLIAVLENKELRTRLGKNARQQVITKYSLDANKENFLRLFEA